MSSTSPRIESSHGELCRKAPFTASNFKCVEDRLQTTLFTFETTRYWISNLQHFPLFSVYRHLASFSCADEVMYNSSKQCYIIRVNNVTVQLRVCMFRLEQDSSETYFSPGNIHLNFANWFTKKWAHETVEKLYFIVTSVLMSENLATCFSKVATFWSRQNSLVYCYQYTNLNNAKCSRPCCKNFILLQGCLPTQKNLLQNPKWPLFDFGCIPPQSWYIQFFFKLQGDPRTVTCGRYASYWNAFLFIIQSTFLIVNM